VSAFRKLFIATALIATGLSVATFLGEPTALKQFAQPPAASPQSPTLFAAPFTPTQTPTIPPGSVKLVPDSNLEAVVTSTPTAPSLLSPLGVSTPIAAAPFAPEPPRMNAASEFQPLAPDHTAPMAKLRNEAPRPIGNEPRSPATIRRAPPVDTNVSQAAAATDPYRASPPFPAQFVATSSDWNPTTAPSTAATFVAPVPLAENRPPAPPQESSPAEADEPRTHIVVDGDSLAKLANLYLDDPTRGKEIYELNREALSNPDLLPIGIELKIPERTAHNAWAHQSRRLPGVGEAAVREAASGDLVPVRSLTSYENLAPRAQLSTPEPVK
jgi:nucleoid-associated protein YgaU